MTETVEQFFDNKIIRLSYLFLLITEIILVITIGFGVYRTSIIILLSLFAIEIIIEPFWGIVLLGIISFGIEGRLIEENILFRLYGFNWYLIDYVLFILFLSIIPRIFSKQYFIKLNSLLISFFIFFIILFLSVLVSLKMGIQKVSIFHDLRGFFYYIVMFPTFFVIHNSQRRKKFFLIVFLIVGTIKCVIDSYLSLFVYDKTFDTGSRILLNFARLQGYSEVVYPIMFIASISVFFIYNKISIKLIILPSIFFSFIALLLSYTRGSWLAVFLSLILLYIILFFYREKKVKLKYVLFGTLLILIILFILDITGIFPLYKFFIRLTSISYNKIDTSNLGRLVEWATALSAFKEHIFWGTGLGWKVSYFAPGIGYKSTIFIHNSYIYILTKMGVVGFISFFSLIGLALLTGKKLINRKMKTHDEKIYFVFFMMLIVIIFKALTTWVLNLWVFAPVVGIILGYLYDYKVSIEIEQ